VSRGDRTITAPNEVDDAIVVEALRRGDERAFRDVVSRHHGGLVRVARTFVGSTAVAEEVAQDTWLAMIDGIDRFQGRSSLSTWLYAIVVNKARTRGVRDARHVSFDPQDPSDAPWRSVDPGRFDVGGEYSGHWNQEPVDWRTLPEAVLLANETRAVIDRAIAALPPAQQAVITLRDVEGFATPEVCEIVGVSEANQRVLLHRARSRVRAALERHLETSS
jgi:RNA polymerase sigma-70 factor, ECF subfamily